MGTFTSDGKEYCRGPVPEPFVAKPSTAKAWAKGWDRGIYSNFAHFHRYKRPTLQAAYDAWHAAARDQRRAAGETVSG